MNVILLEPAAPFHYNQKLQKKHCKQHIDKIKKLGLLKGCDWFLIKI